MRALNAAPQPDIHVSLCGWSLLVWWCGCEPNCLLPVAGWCATNAAQWLLSGAPIHPNPPAPALPPSPLQAGCTCDICTGHMPHAELVQRMSRSVFCPIIASNTQSSRRLSEAVLTGEGGLPHLSVLVAHCLVCSIACSQAGQLTTNEGGVLA